MIKKIIKTFYICNIKNFENIKRKILFIIFIYSSLLYPQEVLQCVEDFQPGIIDNSIYSHAVQRNANDTSKLVLQVFFHIIRNDDGSIGIKILQLGQEIIPIISSKTPMPGPNASSSTIITTSIDLNNITIRYLTKEETYDPNLIQSLEPNKIHKIIRNLSNGETDIKVIFKTDN